MYNHLSHIPSEINNISQMEGLATQVVKEYDMPEEKYPNILISLTEAVSNAILHGNKEDVKKMVDISVQRSKEGISLRVKDTGPGYDYNNIPDPSLEGNREEEGGRGVFLIKDLADSCVFLDNGATIEMFFSYT